MRPSPYVFPGLYGNEVFKLDITQDDICIIVSAHFNKEISLKSRREDIVLMKNMVCYLTRKYTSLTLKQIGSFFSISHATVIHSINQIENNVKVYPSIKRDLRQITDFLISNYPPLILKR